MANTNRLSVLSNLYDYSKASESGNASLKSSLWQITKLRRKQNRGYLTMEDTFSAEQIREELRARTLVRNTNDDDEEPGLVSEGRGGAKPSLKSIAPMWKCVDVLEEKASNKENPSAAGLGANATANSSGLRQRKNKGVESSSSSSKTPMTKEDPIIDEEELLLQRDPLELFTGVRPGDLKMAQKNAKEALESYIQAATRAAMILSQIDAATTKGK